MRRRLSNRRHWDPKSLGGCVLHLPFYRYGNEVQKIWDLSGNNNHGLITGCTPAIYPLLSGAELVTNGGMEVGNPPTGWTAIGTPDTFEQSAVQKHSGASSLHIIEALGAYTGGTQNVSKTAGKIYKFGFWYYIVSGTLYHRVGNGDDSQDLVGGTGALTTTGSWLYKEIIVTETITGTGGGLKLTNEAVASEFYIDDVSIQEVVGYEGLGWGFDGVDDEITIADNPTLDITDNLTILGWVYHKSPFYAYIMAKMSGVADAQIAMLIQLESGITVLANVGTVWSQLGQNIPLTVGKWHCIGFRYNSVSGGFTYLNGVVTGASSGSGVLATNNEPLYIGGGLGSWGKVGWGEILIFNRLFSAQEYRNYFELTRHRYGV